MGRVWLGFLLLVTLTVQAETLTGKVVGVHDGDTLTLLVVGNQQVKVRLAGIDAPELKQPYGQQAKQALSALAFGQEVKVDGSGPDKYGRTLGTVWVGTVNVNAELVKQGAAWVYRAYPHDPQLPVLESQAHGAKRGLWALQSDQRCPPWDWRRKVCAVEPPVDCGTKRTCRDMADCAEARRYLTVCKVKSLDGDGDGMPCEALCR